MRKNTRGSYRSGSGRRGNKKNSKLIWGIGAIALAVILLPIYTNQTHKPSFGAAPGTGAPQGTVGAPGSRTAPQTQQAQSSTKSTATSSRSSDTAMADASTAASNAGSTATLSTAASNASTAAASKTGGGTTTQQNVAQKINQNVLQNTTQSSLSTAYLVEQAFSASHAKAASSEVHSWVMVNHKFDSVQELSTISKAVEKEFQLQQAKSVARTDKNEHFYEIYGTRSSGATASITVSSFKFPNAPSQTILIIQDDNQRPNMAQLTSEYKQIAQAQLPLGLSPEISACIKGFTNDRIDGGLATKLENQVFQAVRAKRVEGINTQNVTSISAYSPKSANYIMTNTNKMNLQLGLHYDNEQNKTEVIVGAPYITITY